MILRTTLFKKTIGAASGQVFLGLHGYDAFVATKDVAACLRDAGLDIAAAPTSKRDVAKIQQQFNAWEAHFRPPAPTLLMDPS